MGGNVALGALRELASDEDPMARQSAQNALARLGEESAMETLQTVSSLERVLLLREVPLFAGLSPDDLIDIAACHGLHFHSAAQEGVVFHLIGALSEFGKLGLVSVAGSYERAQMLYDDTVAVLDREAD